MQSFVALFEKLLSRGYSKEYINLMKNFIEAHIKFDSSKNYRIFEKKMDKMVKYETTAEILSFFDFEKRLEISQKSEKKALVDVERFRKSAERARKKEERERQEKERERQEKERERQEKERERQEKELTREHAVLGLLSQGMGDDVISAVLSISVESIAAIREKYKDNNPIAELLNRHSKIRRSFFRAILNKTRQTF